MCVPPCVGIHVNTYDSISLGRSMHPTRDNYISRIHVYIYVEGWEVPGEMKNHEVVEGSTI